ncbi:MAG: MATE family efflux transporter [Propioniciclava sp.]
MTAPVRPGREVLALAVPAFATLVSEPLLQLADSAIIGHLGTPQLAGLGIAGNIVGVLVGLCVFLAYGTTGLVARRMGAGDTRGALAAGVDGLGLAAVLGIVLTVALQVLVDPVVGLYRASGDVAGYAVSYLRVVALAFPFLLVMLASTGVLRGLQDTRTPLKVTIGINVANIGLNLALVYGAGLGILGAALGTLIAQAVGSTILAAVVLRGARKVGAPVRFRPWGIVGAARAGAWLVLRSAALWLTLTATTVVATRMGAISLAAHQIVTSLWMFLAFALDALAIAAQAIVGRYLGAGDATTVRRITGMLVGWGVWFGVILGAVVAATSAVTPMLFTPDESVRSIVSQVLLVVAAQLPIAGLVYLLDGVLIGAGDTRYLALAGTVVALAYLPFAWAVSATGASLAWLWAAYGVSMLGRAVVLGLRARGTAWQRLGI